MSNPKPLRAVLYLRKSTDEQADSIVTQRSSAERWCVAQGWTVVGEYVDSGISRTEFSREKRRGWYAMRDDAPAGAFDVVVVRDASRIGGDIGRALVFVTELLDARVRLFCYADGREVAGSNALQCIMLALQLGMAQGEVEAIRARTREALLTKARRGLVAGGIVFGYRNVPAPDGSGKKREIVAEQADVIREVFERYAAGDGLRTIAKSLNDRGVASPRAGRRGIGMWTPGAVREMVRRPLYAGRIEWGKTHKAYQGGTRMRTERHACEGVALDAPELRIVAPSIWERVAARCAVAPKKSPGPPAAYLLSGLLRCEACGGPLTVINGRSSYDGIKVYACARRRDRGQVACSSSTRRDVFLADCAMVRWVKEHVLTERMVMLVRDGLREALYERSAGTSNVERKLDVERVALERQITGLIAALAEASPGTRPLIHEGLDARRARLEQVKKELAQRRALPVESDLLVHRIEREALARLDDLRTVLSRAGHQARALLSSLFPNGARLLAVPGTSPQQVEIEGVAHVGRNLLGNWASPAGRSPLPDFKVQLISGRFAA